MDAIDCDRLDDWGQRIGEVIAAIGGDLIIAELAATKPEFIEDALDWLYERLGRERVLDAVVGALQGAAVRLFHGTRLSDSDVGQVRQQGLKPLRLADRRSGLVQILGRHPRWPEVASRLDEAIDAFGVGARAGKRGDGCVHACFSRSGLLLGCNHYLALGAEVDKHICHHLFGDDSADHLLRAHRKPYLISFEVGFDLAARSCTWNGDLQLGRGVLVARLVGPWAYRQTAPRFRISTQRDCTAARVEGSIGPERLSITSIEDVELQAD